jgi:hypothetical protein
MLMCVCYLGYHEAELCCYIVIRKKKKTIMSITAVLLPFLTYLLTLSLLSITCRIVLQNVCFRFVSNN